MSTKRRGGEGEGGGSKGKKRWRVVGVGSREKGAE